MQTKWPWFEREFRFDFPVEKMPDVIERLFGTPVRIALAVDGIGDALLQQRESDESWSIKQNIGHLGDLEPLWAGRIEDVLQGLEFMRDTDLTNRPTFDANHDQASSEKLVARFKEQRDELVDNLLSFNKDQWAATALHPRLKVPMRVVDLCQFVAEHDDYHLARIRYLKNLFVQ